MFTSNFTTSNRMALIGLSVVLLLLSSSTYAPVNACGLSQQAAQQQLARILAMYPNLLSNMGQQPGSFNGLPNNNNSPFGTNQQQPNNQFPNNQFPNNQFPNNQFPNNQFPNNQIPNNQFPNNQIPTNQIPTNLIPNQNLPNNLRPNNLLPNQNQQQPNQQQPNQQQPNGNMNP